MELSPRIKIESENNFKNSRDSKGYVKANVKYNQSYIEDIKYAFKQLGILVVSKNPNLGWITISFPFNEFNDLKKIVGIEYVDIEPVFYVMPRIPTTNDKVITNEKIKQKKSKYKNSDMEKYMNLKTIAGVGVGVAIGHFAMKTSSPLFLLAFGIGGGILANMIKTESEKTEDDEGKMFEAMQKQNMSGVEGMSFNPTVGYFTPYGSVEETSPSDYIDVNF